MKSNKKKKVVWLWRTVSYVWRTKTTWSRIVYYLWKVINEYDDTVDCEFVDQYIHNSYEPFIIKNIWKSFLTLL